MALERASEHGLPQVTLEAYDQDYRDRHLLHGVVAYWAARAPEAPALIHHERGQTTTWSELEQISARLAASLLRLGFRKGDFLAVLMPFSAEHIFLEYACFKIGLIHAPLDLRLRPPEVLRAVGQLPARGFAFPGRIGASDFRELAHAVRRECPSVECLIQCPPQGEAAEGAIPFPKLLEDPQPSPLRPSSPQAAPEAPKPPCSRTATSPARICASAQPSASAPRHGSSSTCLRPTSAGRPKP